MEFLNTLKGSTTQTIIHCLLRQAGYPVVSTSVEALIPSLTLLDWASYDRLDLGAELRLLPDLLTAEDLSRYFRDEVVQYAKVIFDTEAPSHPP